MCGPCWSCLSTRRILHGQQLDRKTLMHSKLLARIVLSSSTCQVVLHSLPLILFCQRECLILFFSCWFSVMSPPDASACRTAICSSSLFSGSIGTSPSPRSTRALFLFHSLCVSAILSLYAFILAFPVKVLSMIVLIRSRHPSLCGFVALPCDASAAQPGQPPVCS